MIKNIIVYFLTIFTLSGCASNDSNESQYFEDGDVEYGRYG